MKEIFDKIKKIIEQNYTFLITGHIRPDADTIGSELAMYFILTEIGKEVEVVHRDTLPEFLHFLPGIKNITNTTKLKKYDVGIIFECPETSRINCDLDINSIKIIINIDHHQTRNNNLGITLIDPLVSSCAELVWEFLRNSGYNITKDIALCLYTGIVSDTGKFQHVNTTSKTLRVAADLLDFGLDPSLIYRNLFGIKSIETLKLIGLALTTLKVENNISYIEITKQMYEQTGVNIIDIEEIITFAGMIQNIKVFVLFRELKNTDLIKVSLRSYGDIDVNKIAIKYGGGGHQHAAGFQIKGEISHIKQEILTYLKNVL